MSRNNYRKQTNKASGARKEKKNDKAVLQLTTKEGQDFQLSENAKIQLQEEFSPATQDLAKEHTNDLIRKNGHIHCVDDEVMTMSTTAKVKISNNNYHSSKRRRSRTTRTKTPLLPQIIGYDATDNSVICLRSEKSISMKDSWTKERLIDELTKQLIRIDDKPICNCTGSGAQLDISKELRQSSVLYNKKYLLRAQRAIATYYHPVPIVLVINLFDLTNRLKAELVDLASSKGTLSYVLYSVVQRIFAAVSSNWFYESAAEEIEVLIQS